VVGHQECRKRGLLAGQSIFSSFFLFRDPFGGVLKEMRKRHERGLGSRVERDGKSAERAACEGDGQGHPEGANVTPEGLWQGLKKPFEGENAALSFTSFVKFSVAAGDELLEVAARFRFRSEGNHLCEFRRGALAKEMIVVQLSEGHAMMWLGVELIEGALQLEPAGPVG